MPAPMVPMTLVDSTLAIMLVLVPHPPSKSSQRSFVLVLLQGYTLPLEQRGPLTDEIGVVHSNMVPDALLTESHSFLRSQLV